jgi:CheY-like chemotaxis protein
MNVPIGPLLVVEDMPNVLELLEVTLRFKGYPVISARNGQEAMELIEKEPPAIVITDILMPKMDGYALAHSLRTNPRTRHIPIIFLSATYVTPEDKAFALSLGAVRFLEKPVEIARTERLLQTLPHEQQPAFEALLAEARQHQKEIQTELDQLYQLLSQVENPTLES